jgi:tRNA (guanine-N7-)-methyltransferase
MEALPPRRLVRSYALRGGRISPAQRRALDELAPTHLLSFSPQPLDLRRTFGRDAPCVVEIGFGMGQGLAQMAAAQAERDFIGIEVHEAGVGALLRRIGDEKLDNLRLVRHDAVEVLEHMIAPATLAGLQVFFPDPWPKKRHHKRRLIQPRFVALAASRLAPGGVLHCATDWLPYAEQMLEVLSAEALLVNTAAAFAERPASRPLTRFEARGLALGHGVWDLVFKRAS